MSRAPALGSRCSVAVLQKRLLHVLSVQACEPVSWHTGLASFPKHNVQIFQCMPGNSASCRQGVQQDPDLTCGTKGKNFGAAISVSAAA